MRWAWRYKAGPSQRINPSAQAPWGLYVQCEESRGIDLIAISYNGCQTRRLDVNIGQNQGKCGVISSPIVVHTGVRWQRLDILQTLLHSVAWIMRTFRETASVTYLLWVEMRSNEAHFLSKTKIQPNRTFLHATEIVLIDKVSISCLQINFLASKML